MGLPLPLATCLSWVGPPSNLGGGGVRALCSGVRGKWRKGEISRAQSQPNNFSLSPVRALLKLSSSQSGFSFF